MSPIPARLRLPANALPLRRAKRACLALSAVAALSGCGGGGDEAGGRPVERRFDFAVDAPAWTLGSADYSADTAPTDLGAQVQPAPAPVSGRVLAIGATNRSDDLFVYVLRRLDGLPPGERYRATLTLQFVATLPQGCFGVGGAPAEAVYIKAGVGTPQPQTLLSDGEYRFSWDKGNQGEGGPQGPLLGDLSSSGRDCIPVPAEVRTLSARQSAPVVVDADGRAWLWVGYDSGYEAGSTLPLLRLTLRLDPLR
ncbi:MAG: hypothetical protein L6Q75_16625 [Burkholderiaceae bacterium]|nr:hypothetical protein [Burkholderiaceae bacterium]